MNMQGKNGKLLNSRIKAKVYVNELEIKDVEEEIESIVSKYLIEKCGAGNFLFEMDVQY